MKVTLRGRLTIHFASDRIYWLYLSTKVSFWGDLPCQILTEWFSRILETQTHSGSDASGLFTYLLVCMCVVCVCVRECTLLTRLCLCWDETPCGAIFAIYATTCIPSCLCFLLTGHGDWRTGKTGLRASAPLIFLCVFFRLREHVRRTLESKARGSELFFRERPAETNSVGSDVTLLTFFQCQPLLI